MPKLNEYLGSIISSLNTARVMADIQTVKVAEDYAKHDLLKHFSIPRMRIDDVEITIPVAIDSAEETLTEPVDIIKNRDFNSAIYSEVTRSLGMKSLPKEMSSQVRSMIAENTQTLENQINKSGSLSGVTDFSKRISDSVRRIATEQKMMTDSSTQEPYNIEQRIAETAHTQINAMAPKKSIGDMNVIAEAHLLREQKPENIMQIKLKISEDAMEWQQSEGSDGQTRSMLLPE
ncbi:MAG: hypothetical protein CMI00_14555 [Oceanospirillaceae bacterium]|nr:hypothetical protein [Oceanospirillaceae bacterium]|tara:strand:+ start:1023 stop:1721 length:699 start_codon:yes stop_codon:yes gene_type:complete